MVEAIPDADFQPLADAAVFVLTNTSKKDRVADARPLRIMLEREAMGGIIGTLGGRWISSVETFPRDVVTHAVWVDDPDAPAISHMSITEDAATKLRHLEKMGVPVVTKAWLDVVSMLQPGQHWCEVDATVYMPEVIAALRKASRNFTPLDTFETGGMGICDGATSVSSAGGVLGRNGHRSSHSAEGSDGTRTDSSTTHQSSRRDRATQLGASISATFSSLRDENPDLEQEIMLKRAIELSMLDFAIVHKTHNTTQASVRKIAQQAPHELLGVPERDGPYPPDELRAAYKKRALETHPDKGGRPGDFEAVARAYRQLLNPAKSEENDTLVPGAASAERALKSTAHWDSELKEHRDLVRELYQNHGEDVDANVSRQNAALESLGLRPLDAGTKNVNEKNEEIRNSCFYLSLAAGYLGGIGALTAFGMDEDEDDDEEEGSENESTDVVMGNPEKDLLRQADDALIMETALMLKRAIEAAVVSAHPEWAARGMVGEEVQAFSDFLVYVLESAQTIVSEWAVVVFDTCSGFVDVYQGKFYEGTAKDGGDEGKDEKDDGEEKVTKEEDKNGDDGDEERRRGSSAHAAAYTITLRYVPGHYQPLVSVTSKSTRPTLKQITSVLDKEGVMYVVTDGAA